VSAIVLPAKLSELTLLGLDALAKVEAQPDKYRVTMGAWHEPSKEFGRCLVCFAGAVIAVTLQEHPLKNATPGMFLAPMRGRLLALDRIRTGSLAEAAFLAGLDGNTQLQARRLERPMPDYEESPTLFRAAMFRQAVSLQEAGL
jgi:hypothetical protein